MTPARIIHTGYGWSEDYDLLLRLMDQGEVIGTVLYMERWPDPVMFRKRNDSEFTYVVSARGIHYIETWSGSSKYANQEEEFKAECAEKGARFLVPQNTEADS